MASQIVFLVWCVIASLCGIFAAKKVEEESEFLSHSSFNLPLEHAFEIGESAKFSPRGSIVFKTLRSTHASLAREVVLTSEEYIKLEELVRNDGVYRIRAPVKIGESLDTADTFYVSTFVKACHLLFSKLSEIITVSIDNTGNVIGISLRTDKQECSQNLDEIENKIGSVRTFNTTVLIQLQSAGAVPETQAFVRRFEKEEAEKRSGKNKDNRSFIAKYWMYIVPVVFIMMLAGQQDPNEGQGS